MSDADRTAGNVDAAPDEPAQNRFFDRLKGMFTRRPEEAGFGATLDDSDGLLAYQGIAGIGAFELVRR